MKFRKLFGVAVVIVAASVPVFAHSQNVSAEDYDASMKAIFGAVRSVGGAMEAQDAGALGTAGTAMVDNFTKVKAYWEAANDATALELAMKAEQEARKFQEAGAAGNFDAAQAAFGEIRSTCTPCHEGYRERDANGDWQIKSGS